MEAMEEGTKNGELPSWLAAYWMRGEVRNGDMGMLRDSQ